MLGLDRAHCPHGRSISRSEPVTKVLRAYSLYHSPYSRGEIFYDEEVVKFFKPFLALPEGAHMVFLHRLPISSSPIQTPRLYSESRKSPNTSPGSPSTVITRRHHTQPEVTDVTSKWLLAVLLRNGRTLRGRQYKKLWLC